jgi:hypothetical protein
LKWFDRGNCNNGLCLLSLSQNRVPRFFGIFISGTKIIADQILLDVKGLKAKIPANTWNVTSEADDTEEETREGMEEVVVPPSSVKKLKKSTGECEMKEHLDG